MGRTHSFGEPRLRITNWQRCFVARNETGRHKTEPHQRVWTKPIPYTTIGYNLSVSAYWSRTLLFDSTRVMRIKLRPPLVIRLGGAPVTYSDSRFEDGTAIPWTRFSAAVGGVRLSWRRCSCRALHRTGSLRAVPSGHCRSVKANSHNSSKPTSSQSLSSVPLWMRWKQPDRPCLTQRQIRSVTANLTQKGRRFGLKVDCTIPANAEATATSENDKVAAPSRAKKNTGE